MVLISVTVYLGFADSLAIGSGTWTIAGQKSLAQLNLGKLPVEELIFFLVTNTLIVFGMLLLMSEESAARWGKTKAWIASLRERRPQSQP
jgi:putative membrane protein